MRYVILLLLICGCSARRQLEFIEHDDGSATVVRRVGSRVIDRRKLERIPMTVDISEDGSSASGTIGEISERDAMKKWLDIPDETIVYCGNDRCHKPTLLKQWKESRSCPLCGLMSTHPPCTDPNDERAYVIPFATWQKISHVRIIGVQPTH